VLNASTAVEIAVVLVTIPSDPLLASVACGEVSRWRFGTEHSAGQRRILRIKVVQTRGRMALGVMWR